MHISKISDVKISWNNSSNERVGMSSSIEVLFEVVGVFEADGAVG